MKQKHYPVEIKKNLLLLLHLLFLALTVFGIGVIYLHSQSGTGVSWIFDRSYEDTDEFQQQFQDDLDCIFKYVAYRDVFETDGSLDLSREMFSVSRGDGPELIYTLEEVLRYAKSQGFYLNDQFDVVNDLFIYDNASTNRDQRINWRAYSTNQTLSEPGDAYTSLLDLSREVLQCLSDYYTVYYRMLVNPSNLYFQICYEIDDDEQLIYSNCEDQTVEQLREAGRYCYLDSESIFIETNFPSIPKNITVAMEENNFSDADYYYIIAAVDTSYAADDVYADQALAHDGLRDYFIEGLAAMGFGILGCLITLVLLAAAAGYRGSDYNSVVLHDFDMISTETCLLFTAFLAVFSLFLGEKIGYRLLHLIFAEPAWDFAERMLQAILIYLCCLFGAFSLLRRYKARQLWVNSSLYHLYTDLNEYFAHSAFTQRLTCLYLAFIAFQVGALALIGVGVHFWWFTPAKVAVIAIAVIIAIVDYQVYRMLFSTSIQEDQIADAIGQIAGGNTSYQMDLSSLNGKELKIARSINQIGVGLEQALQEQVKSERLKADLITNVSHDIKTPLTSIINYVDLIKREQVQNEKVQEYLEILEQKSQRLKILTEDLVEASKASSGNLKMDMIHLDLVEMIWQTNGEFEEKFSERQLELISDLPEHSVMIEADGRHLWRVLENLYNNAFKYAMKSSRVYTSITCVDGRACFTIKNVSEHPLNVSSDELTERFVRGDVSRATEGSGLGLSIAQSLAKLQGGTFEIIIDGDLFKVQLGFAIIG
ncbi:MAG: HAMP domain-containing histidine kinase [Clostridiales bacterium]|nr:HAMP domain-containing histidine kinase [Clostridiales bacterium]